LSKKKKGITKSSKQESKKEMHKRRVEKADKKFRLKLAMFREARSLAKDIPIQYQHSNVGGIVPNVILLLRS